MASREKKPLAPSKSKQKANNDSAGELKSRKIKLVSSLKNQQLAQDILEAVATGSQLPARLEASVPRKKVIKNLKQKPKLIAAKVSLIKNKVAKKVPIRNQKRIKADPRRGIKSRKAKQSEVAIDKHLESSSKALELSTDSTECEGKGVENGNKSAKYNQRTKKLKAASRVAGDVESTACLVKDTEVVSGVVAKTSPKLNKKGKGSSELAEKGAKSPKFAGGKKQAIKDREYCLKSAKRCSIKEEEENKLPKSALIDKNSIDLTIDEVIASSMLSEPEAESQENSEDRIEGKITRSRKMLIGENSVPEIEIKKEPDTDEIRTVSDGEYPDGDKGNSFQNSIQLRKRSTTLSSQRSLRNGKLRQHSDSGLLTDIDAKKRHRLNSDDPANSETSTDHAQDGSADTESCFSESSGNESQSTIASSKDDTTKDPMPKSFEAAGEIEPELENNNNSERADRTGEVGPTLRSKTKAKCIESEGKTDDVKTEDTHVMSKSIEEESKKTSGSEQLRKETILAKFIDKPKGRRSSLNIDMKKTVSSFYGTDKSDGNPKSQIDQMIENIKLTIAKSIESKIFGGPEKGLGLTKSFDVPKIEEIIAPLSTDSQKMCLEETTDDDKPNVSKSENKSESSENSVPKVADTAKEIEKLVMGDIEPVETQSQNTQKSESPNNESIRELNSVSGSAESNVRIEDTPESSAESVESVDKTRNSADSRAKSPLEDNRKSNLRKSPRIVDKSTTDSTDSETTPKKSSKPINSECQKPDNVKENVSEDAEKCSKTEDTDFVAEESEGKDVSEDCAEKSAKVVSLADEEKSAEELTIHEPQISTDAIAEQSLSSSATEEPETLESISREVEKLVAQDETAAKVNDDKKESEQLQNCLPSNTEVSSDKDENDEQNTNNVQLSDSKVEPVVSSDRKEPSTNDSQDKVVDSNGIDDISTLESNSEKDEGNSCQVTKNHSDSEDPKSVLRDTDVLVQEEEKDAGNEESKETEECLQESKSEDPAMTNESKTCTQVSPNKSGERKEISPADKLDESSSNEKDTAEQKSVVEENKRVLRARDKQKKSENRQTSRSRERVESKVKIEDESSATLQTTDVDNPETPDEKTTPEDSTNKNETENATNTVKVEPTEPQTRTRRSREVKKRKEETQQVQSSVKPKRAKRDARRSDQQNKEETLLDNEVAKINENNRTFFNERTDRAENLRGFSECGRSRLEKVQNCENNARSKSENDLMTVNGTVQIDRQAGLSEKLTTSKESNNGDIGSENESNKTKTPEISQKDLDEASTSGESSNSISLANKFLETPEDKAKKESILRLLGLESLEKAAERLNHQKARKEQYTGTLKTVIRVQNKDKDKDKRRSRSPLKMVLKQGRADGEGDSLEFYTIQKEFGTSGLGDSSSGANRKFSTNHRHSCDEDNEEAPPKDRQSLVIPEKSSSFSIHPGRLCADVCCYCFGKFGSLDTPMHLAQMKSDERRKKILSVERHLTKDSCLCDACYRHVDRKANTSPTNMQSKPQKQHRQLMVSKCSARDCRDPARHHVKRRWLLKIKAGLQNQVNIDWESSQHTSMSFCVSHYAKIERFLTCALCKRRLARNHTHQLANSEVDELTERLSQQGIPVSLAAGTFVCKLCRYFTQLQLKYKDVENMNANHKSFFKSYRKRILHFHDIEVLDNEDEDSSQSHSSKEKDKEKDKRKKSKCSQSKNNSSFKSTSDGATTNSASEKSTPELNKTEETNYEMENENQTSKSNSTSDGTNSDARYLDIESTVEKLKKRKMLDMHSYPAEPVQNTDVTNEVVEILAMDKEVTLTRLPKRPKTSNDIAPVVQRLGANPSISVRTLFPGEEEMNLHANIEFTNVREITPQGWEKCATMIQYDRDTKILWNELQRPYGNQSSFLRHLILLEKYYRSGDLVLAPNASRNAINYSTSVQNRLISFEGPEKMDEPIMEPIPPSEYNNSRRLSGGYVVERDRVPFGNAYSKSSTNTSQTSNANRVFKLNPGVSIIKKPPPNLQRLSLPSTSTTNGTAKRKDPGSGPKAGPSTSASGGKVFQLTEPDFKRLQNLKKQKQMLSDKQQQSASGLPSNSSTTFKSTSSTQYQKAQLAAQTQFQKHLRMQQEMLSRQSRGDFEPLICDMRTLANENSPTQNLIHNLNLPKSIQVTTKPPSSNPIPILPKIPKSLTVIPQTITRPSADK